MYVSTSKGIYIRSENDGRLREYKPVDEITSERKYDACYVAAEGGSLKILKKLYDIGYPVNEETLAIATDCGHVSIVSWLLDINCPIPSNISALAAKHNPDGDMLSVVIHKGCPLTADAYEAAADADIMHNIILLHNNNCPKNTRACTTAIRKGNLEVFKELRRLGCPFNKAECLKVAKPYLKSFIEKI